MSITVQLEFDLVTSIAFIWIFYSDFVVLRFTYSNCSPEVFLRKGVLKTCSKCTGEQLKRSVISIKLQYNFTEITLRCSPVNLLHIFRMPFYKNTSGRQLLYLVMSGNEFHNCASSDSKLLCLNLLTFRNEHKEQ